jgi:Tfp pilus assembly protein PilX
MEERMAGNFREYSAAFDAAETALRTGEVVLSSTSEFVDMDFDGTDGTFEVTSASVDPARLENYSLSVPADVLTYDSERLVRFLPEYYIEQLPEIALPASDLTVGFQDQAPRVRYYRVTAKGTGISGISNSAEVILQSTYFR